MATIGDRELQLRELAKNTRAGKNARAAAVNKPDVIEGLKKAVARIPAKKKPKKAKKRRLR